MSELKYKRVLLKLSGEALAGERKNGVDAETLGKICDKIKEIVDKKIACYVLSFNHQKNIKEYKELIGDENGNK